MPIEKKEAGVIAEFKLLGGILDIRSTIEQKDFDLASVERIFDDLISGVKPSIDKNKIEFLNPNLVNCMACLRIRSKRKIKII